MTLRAYFLLNVLDDVDQPEFVKILRELERTPGVEFVDSVSGAYDMVVIVDTSTSIESVVANIKEKAWVKSIEVLRIVSIFERSSGMRGSRT
ncbi:MAG: hypothetical protein Q8J63_00440 [Candidatus Aquicultor sp.]|nr:hypothetical protein [Candidatus Aquicultor sp.]